LATIERLSTSAAAPSDRLAFWNEASEKAFGSMFVDAEPDGFEAALTRLRTNRFELVSVMSTPAAIRSAAREAKIGADATVFRLQLVRSGASLLRNNGRETIVRTGDLIVANVSKPYELLFQEPVHGLTITLPTERFGSFSETLEAVAGRRIDASARAAAVLSTFVRSTWDHLADGDGEDWPDSAEDVIWDLIESVLRGDTDSEIGTGRADHLRRSARACVDARLSDSVFGTSQISEALGVSARYLQMVFAEVGTTPSRFLLARRLEAAAATLRRVETACSITEVALGSGFNDLSYFSRSFRRRFGVSPLAYRERLGTGPAAWL
jgi:AraC-like DNA-binding protein